MKEYNINDLVIEVRKEIMYEAVADFCDDVRAYAVELSRQNYIQPKIAEWYNNEGIVR